MLKWQKDLNSVERERCSSILLHGVKMSNLEFAKQLAFASTLSTGEAIELLTTAERPVSSSAEYLAAAEADRIEAIILGALKAEPHSQQDPAWGHASAIELAMHCAFNTSLPADRAVAVVEESVRRTRSVCFNKMMEETGNPDVEPDWPRDEVDLGGAQFVAAAKFINERG